MRSIIKGMCVALVLVVVFVALVPERVDAQGPVAATFPEYKCLGTPWSKKVMGKTIKGRALTCKVYDSNGKQKKDAYTKLGVVVPVGSTVTSKKVSGGWIYPKNDTNTLYLASEWEKK